MQWRPSYASKLTKRICTLVLLNHLFRIAENGLEAAISETEVFDCVLAILENEITVDFNTPLEDQFPDLSSSRFTTYANQFRQRREDNTDYNDGIRARLDVSVQSVELTTNDAGSIAVSTHIMN